MSSSQNNNISVKFVLGDEIRRVSVPSTIKFDDLKKLASDLFKNNSFTSFRYEDDDDDTITVSSDVELQEAFSLFSDSNSLKLWLTVPQPQQHSQPAQPAQFRACGGRGGPWWLLPRIVGSRCGGNNNNNNNRCNSSSSPSSGEPVVHPAICYGCQQRIVGLRFKCQTCPDFDFCERCYAFNQNTNGAVHTLAHNFSKIEKPTWSGSACNSNNNNNNNECDQQQRVGSCPFFSSGAPSSGFPTVHPAVCDSCEERIVGIRFKCNHPSCPDYDLCESCFALNDSGKGSIHSAEHNFEKIERPSFVHWRQAVCAAARARQQQQTQTQRTGGRPVEQSLKIEEPSSSSTQDTLDSKKERESMESPTPAPVAAVPQATPTAVVPSVSIYPPLPAPTVESAPTITNTNTNTNTNNSPAPAPTPAPASSTVATEKTPSNPFEEKLAQLTSMGFADRQQNIALLVKHKADLYETVRELLSKNH